MDYKNQIEQAKHAAVKWREKNPIVGVGELRVDYMVDDLCRSITDLLARADAAEARCKRLDEARERANEACAKWEYRAEKAENQLREAKHCTAGLSMLIKAIDGKMVMETVLPIARRRLSEYKERFSPEKVVLDSQKEE